MDSAFTSPSRPGVHNSVGPNVRELRKLNQLSQTALGLQVGLDQSTIAKIEGQKRTLTIDEAAAIARALGVKVDRLLDYPGSHQDGLLIALVIEPQRDVQTQIDDLKRRLSGSEDGSLQAAIARVAEGVSKFRAEFPDPFAQTARGEIVERALDSADDVVRRFPTFQVELTEALDRLSARRNPAGAGTRETSRASKSLQARRIRGRGVDSASN